MPQKDGDRSEDHLPTHSQGREFFMFFFCLWVHTAKVQDSSQGEERGEECPCHLLCKFWEIPLIHPDARNKVENYKMGIQRAHT